MLWKGGKNIESNREEKRGEKQRKTKEERVLHALKRGKKTKSPIEKRKGEKSREEIERKGFYMLWKCGQRQTYQSSVAVRENSGKEKV